MRNSATQPDQAPYVLLDGWGMIRSYVSPAADAHLERYLGHQVRIVAVPTCCGRGIPRVTIETMTVANQTRIVSGAQATHPTITDPSVLECHITKLLRTPKAVPCGA